MRVIILSKFNLFFNLYKTIVLQKLIWKIIILCIGCIVFLTPARAQSTDSTTIQLSRKWMNAKAYALKMADLMPAENYSFRPAHEVMSFKEQLLHIADNMKWLSSAFLFSPGKKQVADTAKMDKAAVMKYVSDAYDQGLSAHLLLSQRQLDEVVPFFAGPMTRRQILILMHDHQTHHVGQLIVYLRLKGIKPPAYVGW